jgi:hypothetical protein
MKLNVRDPKVLLEMVQDRLQATNVCKNDPAVRKFGASLRDWEGQLLQGLRLEGLRISKAEDSADEEIVNAVDRLRFVPDLGDEIFVRLKLAKLSAMAMPSSTYLSLGAR